VEREYYVNDAGSQIRRFGEAIQARARGEEPEEYGGEYVAELAARIEGAADGDPGEVAQRGVELMLEGVRETFDRFRVRMDRFFSERSLHESEELQHALERLDGLYEHDGALWLRTTRFGDDKDRVLRRSNGEYTYFASDCAYHLHKLGRRYDRAIDVWGADHHGYMGRLKAAWQALGGDPDLDLARSESQDNPVYYVQYAHARIASILRKAGSERVADALSADLRASSESFHPSARSLLKRLLEFPAEVRDAADRRAPHRMTVYAHETAQEFSAFYRDCRVLGAAAEGGDEDVRIAICVITKRVIARALGLLGISAPERM
jgi:arginyl-tRNA synthetase